MYFYYTAMPVPTQAIGVVNIDGIGESVFFNYCPGVFIQETLSWPSMIEVHDKNCWALS